MRKTPQMRIILSRLKTALVVAFSSLDTLISDQLEIQSPAKQPVVVLKKPTVALVTIEYHYEGINSIFHVLQLIDIPKSMEKLKQGEI